MLCNGSGKCFGNNLLENEEGGRLEETFLGTDVRSYFITRNRREKIGEETKIERGGS